MVLSNACIVDMMCHDYSSLIMKSPFHLSFFLKTLGSNYVFISDVGD